MVDEMRSLVVLIAGLGLAGAAELSSVRAVYVLPMASGLDQYIANRLTTEQVLQVVTDPKRADAVMTDRLGPGFEARMEELYPPPPKPAPVKEKNKDTDKDKQSVGLGDTVNKLDKPGLMSSFGRGKGNVFLVDVKTRRVLWSAFEKPKDLTPKELDRTARRIVGDIRKGSGASR